MAEFYKLHIADWNDGTDELTLEQEAAYLRVVNATRLAEHPPRHNYFVLGGLWRCNERKAKRILQELIDAGKLAVEEGSIVNRRAVDEASKLRGIRADRKSAGSRGGVESGKSRRKALENNDPPKDLLQPDKTRQDETRQEEEVSSSSPVSEVVASGPEPPPDDDLEPQEFSSKSNDRSALIEAVGRDLSHPEVIDDWMGLDLADADIAAVLRAVIAKAPPDDPPVSWRYFDTAVRAHAERTAKSAEAQTAMQAWLGGGRDQSDAAAIKSGRSFLVRQMSPSRAQELVAKGLVTADECRKAQVRL